MGTHEATSMDPLSNVAIIKSDDLDHSLHQSLGTGSRGTVEKCLYKGHYVAVKNIKDEHKDKFLDEVIQLSKIQHDNVVTLIGYTQSPPSLVLEFAENGSLHDIIMNKEIYYNLSNVIQWGLQCTEAMIAMHSMRPPLIHRDVKPANLLLFNGCTVLKVGDFDCCRDYVSRMTACCGTSPFMAPELIVLEAKCRYSHKIDTYSFGVTLWQMVARREPYDKLNGLQIFQLVSESYMRPDPTEDSQLNKIMQRCWDHEPTDRPEMTTVKELLQKHRGATGQPEKIDLSNGDSKKLDLLERTLSIQQRYYGNDSIEVSKTVKSLANKHGVLGNLTKQLSLLERVLAIEERYFGKDHINIANTLTNLGHVCRALGNTAKQRDLLQRTLAIKDKHLGPDHVEVAETLSDLANVYGCLNDVSKEKHALERALLIFQDSYDSDHVDVANTLASLRIANAKEHSTKREIDGMNIRAANFEKLTN